VFSSSSASENVNIYIRLVADLVLHEPWRRCFTVPHNWTGGLWLATGAFRLKHNISGLGEVDFVYECWPQVSWPPKYLKYQIPPKYPPPHRDPPLLTLLSCRCWLSRARTRTRCCQTSGLQGEIWTDQIRRDDVCPRYLFPSDGAVGRSTARRNVLEKQ
jgi:hypothetical protein